MDKLLKCYYEGNLNFILKPEDIDEMSWDRQCQFLEAAVNNTLLKKYPVNREFSRLFFKKLLAYLEPVHEIHDDMYKHLCSLMEDNNNSQQNNFYYRHYIVGNDLNNIVSIKETNNLVINGTTGMRTWQAALKIADWIICNKELFDNKKVLELGSGTGFTGITVAKLCEIKEFILTDLYHEVLKTICENIIINFSNVRQEKNSDLTTFKTDSTILGVGELDWNNFNGFFNNYIPDIIIGADVIYDPNLIKPLCNVLQNFKKRNKYLQVYTAIPVRNDNTYKLFLDTLSTMGFKYVTLNQQHNIYISSDNKTEICLLEIQ